MSKTLKYNYDQFIHFGTWLTLILFWAFVLYYYPSLPQVIPIHFNASGTADGFGNKYNFLFLPSIASVLVLGMGFIHRLPADASAKQEPAFINAMRIVAYLRFILPLVFAGVAYMSYQLAIYHTDSLSSYFLPLVLALIFIPMGYFLWKIYKEG
jgi:hypothetical protein